MIKGKKAKPKDMSREEYFWTYVDKSGDCWVWTGGKNTRGYGDYYLGDRKYMLAHRYSFMLAHGRKPEQHVLHRCDNPPCVNPDHLYEGDQQQNVRDMLDRKRHWSDNPDMREQVISRRRNHR